jgi:hydroxymethylpyrimidine pyrophosphatase-like HAD family hydrolase
MIRLVVLDIDGVLSDGETAPFDPGLMRMLAALNGAARAGHGPAVTFCSGRPGPYVEAVMQMIDGRLPAVFEAGAGLYLADRGRQEPHPGLGDLEALRECRARLQAAAAGGGAFWVQPGKDYTASVFPPDPQSPDLPALRRLVAAVLGPLADRVTCSLTASCVNVVPRGCDKGAGVRLLAERTGIPLSAMLGIGDSQVDEPFLAITGATGAPANASESVKALVGYVSPHRTDEGLRDILRHYGLTGLAAAPG